MHERKGMAAGCLDAETLAAYVDGGLTADERSRVEVHLAACQDCFAVFTESVKTVQAMEEAGEFVQPIAPTSAPVAPVSASVVPIATARRSRLVRWTAAGAGLAAAAAVVLAVWWPRAERPELVDLVAAVGERRPFEPRLTGGFAFAPLSRSRGDGERGADADLLIVAGRILKDSDSNSSTATRLTRAKAAMLVSKPDGVVEELDRIVAEAPGSSDAWSDLAAAWLLRADSEPARQTEYATRSLNAATAALRIDPSLAEAWYNRALALQLLGLREEARTAWDSFLRVESDPKWLEDGRRRRELFGSSRFDTPEGSAPNVAHFQLETLPRLVRAHVESDPGVTSILIEQAEAEARTIESATSDQWPAAAASELTSAARLNTRVVDGLRDVLTGRELFLADRLIEADKYYRKAAAKLRVTSPTIGLWARVELAHVLYRLRLIPAAETLLRELDAEVAERRFHDLRGRVYLLLGLVHWFNEHPDTSIARIRDAERAYLESGDTVGQSQTARVLADHLRHLGQGSEGWRALGRALKNIASVSLPLQRYLTYFEAALFAEDQNDYFAALYYREAAVEASNAVRLAGVRAEALVQRAQTLSVIGERREALADLSNAEELIRGQHDWYVESEVALVRSSLATDAAQVVSLMDHAIEVMGRAEPHALPALFHRRARAELARGNVGPAKLDLARGIAVVERRGRLVASESMREALTDRSSALFTELAALELRSLDTVQSLLSADKGRALSALAPLGRPPTAEDLRAAQRVLDPHTVILAYAVGDGFLISWILTRDQVRGTVQTVSNKELFAAQRVFRNGLTGRDVAPAPEADRWLTSLLLGSSARELAQARHLVVVSDAALSRLPFGALGVFSDRRPLLDRISVSVVPSLALWLARAVGPPPNHEPSRLLVVGDPTIDSEILPGLRQLAFARSEATQVYSITGRGLLLSASDATRGRLLEELARYNVFHFAGHAIVDARREELNGLVLAKDQSRRSVITAAEISRLRLGTVKLAVLAACGTGAVKDSPGDGARSLAGAFLSAGVSTVVASLWDVDDEMTSQMFRTFYQELNRGSKPAQALRRAQLDLLRDSGANSRGVWAAFVLFGNS